MHPAAVSLIALVLGRQTAVAPGSADQVAFVLAVFIASGLLISGLAVHLLTATS
jgi:hypothetical protein